MLVKKSELFSLIFLWFISLTSFALSNELVKEYSYLLFLACATTVVIVITLRGDLCHFMTPSILACLYISVSFTLGAFAFSQGYVLRNTPNYENFRSWEFINISTFYMLVMITLLFSFNVLFESPKIDSILKRIRGPKLLYKHRLKSYLVIYCSLALPFIFMAMILGSEQGSGFEIIPKTIACLAVVSYLAFNKVRYRGGVYILLIMLLAFISVDSKREAVFLIFPMLFLEFAISKQKLNTVLIFKVIVALVFLGALIISMSLVRGYGNFEQVNSIITALPFIFSYMSSESFLAAFFNNIEVNYTYYHSLQAVEYIINDFSLVSAGSTIIKVLFVFYPRELGDIKPSSIIDLYTTYHDPTFRAIGGSWPVNFFSELFWNFGYVAPIFGVLLFGLIGKLYIAFLRIVEEQKVALIAPTLFIYMNFLTYVRGSGLDMYFVFSLISLFVCILAYFIFYILGKQ
ncbi:oligosaccharide repeat unit polymerase [Psychrosphaera ytuae]|uniref:Oligosaccharide repeat unit polymerase n=1 Tax=Psychrosphaera ytuae TaxID=2820710 RepID=A0A975DD16_9GAMM|nr:O-antigen polymerase [Psychrosphaera ytuae]QTH64628.1 oligosaccharide repeat unit polymerase [Psychrosphaera ytuae]